MNKYGVLLLLFFGISPALEAQVIRGQVRDGLTLHPLAGANVRLAGVPEQTATDSSGNFRFTGIAAGRYEVRVSFVGYRPVALQGVVANAGRETVLTLDLSEAVGTLPEVVIQPGVGRPANLLGSRSFSIEEVQRYAANYLDPARLVLAYPGVGVSNDQANHLSVRGQSPNTLAWQLEGVEIISPNHLANAGTATDVPSFTGGGVSLLSTQVLGNTRFSSGAYGPAYTNAVGGVLDLSLRPGNAARHEFTFQPSVIGLDAAAEGPFVRGGRASYLINYRYSFTGLLAAAGVKLGDEDIRYQDLSVNISTALGRSGRLSVFYMGGGSRNDYAGLRDAADRTEDKQRYNIAYRGRVGMGGLSLAGALGPRLSGRLAMVMSGRHDVRQQRPVVDDTTAYRTNELRQTKLSGLAEAGYRFDARRHLTAGSRLTVSELLVHETGPYKASRLTGIMNFYADYQHQFSEALKASVGMNTVLVLFSSLRPLAEPRASLQYRLSAQSLLTAAFGLHSQLLVPAGLDVRRQGLTPDYPVYLTQLLPLLRARHYALQYTLQLPAGPHLRAEGYYHQFFKVPVQADAATTLSGLNLLEGFVALPMKATGTGRNYGLELSAEQRFLKNYYYLLSGSLYQARITGSDGIERSGRFNGGHTLALTGGKEWNWPGRQQKSRTVALNLKALWNGGYREMPIDLAASVAAGSTVFISKGGYSQTLPDFRRVDMRLSIRKQKTNYTRTLAFDLQNVAGFRNVAYHYFDAVPQKVLARYQLGLIPVLSYRVDFAAR